MSFNLVEALQKGHLFVLRMSNGSIESPKNGKIWIILTGMIWHNTGTDSTLVMRQTRETYAEFFYMLIASATGNAYVNLYNTNASLYQPSYSPKVLNPTMEIALTGGTNVVANLLILEIDEHE